MAFSTFMLCDSDFNAFNIYIRTYIHALDGLCSHAGMYARMQHTYTRSTKYAYIPAAVYHITTVGTNTLFM